MFKLLKYLGKYKIHAILAPIFKIFEAIFELIVPIVMASLIDKGVKLGDEFYIIKMGIILLSLGVVGLVMTLICQKLASFASQGIGTNLRNECFKKISSLPIASIDKIGKSALYTRCNNDCGQVQTGVAMLIRLAIRAPLLAVGAIIMSMILNFKLSLIVLVSGILIALTILLLTRKTLPYIKKNQKGLDTMSKLSAENINGARVVRAFNKSQKEIEDFEIENEIFAKNSRRVSRFSSLLSPLNLILVNVAVILIIYFGGFSVNIGHMTQGEVIAFVNYMSQIMMATVVLINLIGTFSKANVSSSRIEELLNIKINKEESVDIELIAPPSLVFKNVNFAYNTSKKYAVSKLDFEVLQGETLGVIGGTGSGKSTVVKLLSKLYTTSGIFLNGVELKNISSKSLAKYMGVSLQKPYFFKGTIRENMNISGNFSSEEIFRALSLSACQFIKDLDTEILEGGKNFSGGQKQRLSIARSLVNNPKILILDDSFSGLDNLTEFEVKNNLKSLDALKIIISQRSKQVKDCDKILVLNNGEMVGFGSHNYLLENCEIYREIDKL